ncbi:flagellar hook-associated protein FlgK [Aquibacillus albus]|uniref:Flagellar hook-associated protein 1 n=1 Tax=Aquibacillus albus TaxID=1168171 RepID=A0ABS2MWH5_9BACI|nr:flagellar hook-associated protein FlgK [Aquibacillus albus]MBM7570246.1 flagellar hook-associated protein 1 FlgK [Aquibacillus albus]
MSSFHGLEVAKRALFTQQSALHTTSHNIANANTEGYSRQRVNFEQTSPYPPASRNRPQIPGQVGSGVEAGSIERVRDLFLDVQFRDENSKLGYYESKADAMKQMEGIMNEPSEEGLSNTLDQFWQSLQDLSVNPEDSGARSVVRQRGIAVAETFNYLSDSLEGVRSDLHNEMDVTKKEVNSLVNQINNVNQQIGEIEPHGYLPNDLYDERDRLVDQLSSIVNVNVSYTKSNGNPDASAVGKASIELADREGKGTGVKLVDVKQNDVDVINEMHISYDDNNNVENVMFYNPNDLQDLNDRTGSENTAEELADSDSSLVTAVSGSDFNSRGKLTALIETNGYTEDGEAKGVFNEMLGNLDEMAANLATEFNEVHAQGTNLKGETDLDYDFFVGNTARSLGVSDEIKESGDNIAASKNGDSGDGTNAEELADVLRKSDVGLGEETSFKSYYESVIGEMGVVSQESKRMVENATTLRQQVEENRESVSGVSLDEEMSNMIKFQHAYNAAARSMTTVDEMLDRIINNMGLVGR